MQKRNLALKKLVLAAMFVAMSVVIGIFCKSVLNFGAGLFRVTFENFPIILSGITFGPFIGAATGILSDLVSYLLSGQTYPPNLIVTLGAAMIGFISGLVRKFAIKKHSNAQIILAGSLSHLVGSMIIKPIGLFQFYSWAVLWRIPLYLIIAPIEILILCLLFKNGVFRRTLKEFDKDTV
jgi:ECF transporter S component (folate family)